MSYQKETSALLATHKLRKTSFRQEVLCIFLENRGKALSSSEIESKLEEADRITVYRTLRSFEEKGLIHQAIDGSPVIKYALCADDCSEDLHHDQHAHFHCVKCGETTCLFNALKELKYSTPAGYDIQSTEVILSGLCPNCIK